MDKGSPAPNFLVAHDLDLANKHPMGCHQGELIFDAGAFRDKSVGNVELCEVEVVVAFLVTQ